MEHLETDINDAMATLRREKVLLGSAMLYDEALSPSAVRVGLYMLDLITLRHSAARFHRSGKIRIFPSHRKIGERVHLGKDAIVRAIKLLRACKYIKQVKRGSNESGPNHYRVLQMEERGGVKSPGGQNGGGDAPQYHGGGRRKMPEGLPRKRRL